MNAADADALTKHVWALGFVISFLQLSAFVMAGYLWLTIRAYRQGDTALGVLFTALLLLVGGGWLMGVLLGLVVGWASVRRWHAGRFMAVWSALVVLTAGNLALAVVIRKMSLGEWREWFGWLPPF